MLRNLTANEANLIELLAKQESFSLPGDWKEKTLIEPYEDGLNRLFILHPKGVKEDKKRGPAIPTENDLSFYDRDGGFVSAFLYLDQDRQLFELDLWRPDEKPFIEIPEVIKPIPKSG